MRVVVIVRRRIRKIRKTRTGHDKEVNNLKNAERVEDEKSEEPPHIAPLRRTPERETLPEQTPQNRE